MTTFLPLKFDTFEFTADKYGFSATNELHIKLELGFIFVILSDEAFLESTDFECLHLGSHAFTKNDTF